MARLNVLGRAWEILSFIGSPHEHLCNWLGIRKYDQNPGPFVCWAATWWKQGSSPIQNTRFSVCQGLNSHAEGGLTPGRQVSYPREGRPHWGSRCQVPGLRGIQMGYGGDIHFLITQSFLWGHEEGAETEVCKGTVFIMDAEKIKMIWGSGMWFLNAC